MTRVCSVTMVCAPRGARSQLLSVQANPGGIPICFYFIPRRGLPIRNNMLVCTANGFTRNGFTFEVNDNCERHQLCVEGTSDKLFP